MIRLAGQYGIPGVGAETTRLPAEMGPPERGEIWRMYTGSRDGVFPDELPPAVSDTYLRPLAWKEIWEKSLARLF